MANGMANKQITWCIVIFDLRLEGLAVKVIMALGYILGYIKPTLLLTSK